MNLETCQEKTVNLELTLTQLEGQMGKCLVRGRGTKEWSVWSILTQTTGIVDSV